MELRIGSGEGPLDKADKNTSLKWIHLSYESFLTQAYYEMAGIKGLHEQNGTNKLFYQEINK